MRYRAQPLAPRAGVGGAVVWWSWPEHLAGLDDVVWVDQLAGFSARELQRFESQAVGGPEVSASDLIDGVTRRVVKGSGVGYILAVPRLARVVHFDPS